MQNNENNLSFLKWFISDKVSVVSTLFILLMTFFVARMEFDRAVGNYVTVFFIVLYSVVILKVSQGYNDYLKGRRR
jgi:hypothetical protein